MSAIYFTILTAQQFFNELCCRRVSFLLLSLSLSVILSLCVCPSLTFSLCALCVRVCVCKSLQRFIIYIGLLFVSLINNKLSIIKRSISLRFLFFILVFRSLLLSSSSSRQSRRVLRVHVRERVCVSVHGVYSFYAL